MNFFTASEHRERKRGIKEGGKKEEWGKREEKCLEKTLYKRHRFQEKESKVSKVNKVSKKKRGKRGRKERCCLKIDRE